MVDSHVIEAYVGSLGTQDRILKQINYHQFNLANKAKRPD